METSDYLPLPSGAQPASLDKFLRVWVRIVGAVIAAVAITVLCGWFFKLPRLASAVTGGAPMAVITAVCFLLVAAGLIAWSWERARWARWPWLGMLVIATAVLVERIADVSLGVSEIFLTPDMVSPGSLRGKMSPNAAVCFVCTGLGLLGSIVAGRKRWLVLIPAGVTLCLALLGLLGYASGLRSAHTWGGAVAGMALPAAFLFLVLGATVIETVARFHRGLGFNSPPALFTVALVLLIACGRMSHVMNAEVSLANREVVAAFEFREAMHRYILAMTRMQATDRAYGLTGDEYYAARQAIYVTELRTTYAMLEEQAKEHAFRQKRIATLGPLTAQRIEESLAVMRARRAGDNVEVARLLQPTPRTVSTLAAEMEAEEDIFLREREKTMQRMERNAGLVLAAGVLVAALLLAVAFYLVHRARRALQLSHMALERRVNERTADLQRSEESLRFLADTMPQMVWTTRPDGVVETFNQGWHEYTGLTLEESLENWVRMLHPDDVRPFTEEWIMASRAGREGRGEYRLRRASDGMLRWHLWRARPQRDRAGRLMRWVGTSTDIHDQKEAAHALERAVGERTAELAAAKRELEVANRLQRAVLDGTVLSVIAADAAGIIQIFNTGAERMLGWKRDELVGKQTPLIVHDLKEVEARAADLGERLGRKIEPGFESLVTLTRLGEVDDREWTFVRKDGSRLPVMVSLTALRDQTGEITGFLGIAHDLTADKQAEVVLQERDDRMRLANEAAGVAVWEWNIQTGVVQWHPGMFEIYGVQPTSDGLVNYEVWKNALLPEDLAEQEALLRNQLKTGQRGRRLFRIRRVSDGEVRYVSSSEMIMADAHGQPLRMVGVNLDVTEMKAAEQALRDSEERFRQSFQFAGIGMALVGLDGRWLQVNPAVCQILGYQAEELFTKTFQDITYPDDLMADLTLLRQLVAGERSFYQMEKRYIHREGQAVWGRLTVTLVRNTRGAPVHFVSQIEDITARKELEENLARARDEALAAARLKSEFLANMSHEIRTPMNGVLGMARLLMETRLGQEQRRMGQVVLSSAENLLTIIDDILDFSKIEAGKMRVDPHGFDLVKLVRETTDLLCAQAQAKGVVLVCETGPEKSCGLVGDSGRIRQVLTNLLGNALKFTAQGRVEVMLRIGDEADGQRRFSLTVSDTGIGMEPEVQARLFQPFMQAETGGRKYGGTGLGLAICRQLVELMGGGIGCESSDGSGSRFWFHLELPVWMPDADEIEHRAKPSHDRRSLRLLVAEDNPANQLVARLTLERMGHQVVLANNGREALEKLGGERFDAVLMDCQMPEMDGYEATRRLREGVVNGADAGTPVIALTAYALPGDRARCLAAGMDEYVTKPLGAEPLRQALARCGIDPGKSRTNPPINTASPVETTVVPVLDEQQLEKLAQLKTASGAPLTAQLFAMLIKEMPGRLAALQAAIERREGEPLMRVAHTLAGSCANLGAAPLGAVARELENGAKLGAWEEAAGCLTRLGGEWERLRAELMLRYPESFS